MITLRDFIGHNQEEAFEDFDLTEIQELLKTLANTTPIDIAHAEMLAQQALRFADELIQMIVRLNKTAAYLKIKFNKAKNLAMLNYKSPDNSKITADMRKAAAEVDEEVTKLEFKLIDVEASQKALEDKYDILIKKHHHQKDIAKGLRQTVSSAGTPVNNFGYNND